jgi:hypothetical protein
MSLYTALEQFLIYIQLYSSTCTGEWSTWTANHLLNILRRKKKKDKGWKLVQQKLNLNSSKLQKRKNSLKHVFKRPPSIVPPGGLHPAMFISRALISNHDIEKINVACLLSPIEVARQCQWCSFLLCCCCFIAVVLSLLYSFKINAHSFTRTSVSCRSAFFFLQVHWSTIVSSVPFT